MTIQDDLLFPYVVKTGRTQIVLYVRCVDSKTGEWNENLKEVGFFSTIEGAIRKAIEKKMHASEDVTDLVGVVRKIKQTRKELEAALAEFSLTK